MPLLDKRMRPENAHGLVETLTWPAAKPSIVPKAAPVLQPAAGSKLVTESPGGSDPPPD